MIIAYNKDRSRLKQYQNVTYARVIMRDSTVLISLENDIKHEREYWSDKTLIEVYTHCSLDSIIQIKISNSETIQINKSFFHKGKLVRTHNRDFSDNSGKYNVVTFYHRKTKSREIATRITTYYKDGITDTIRVDNKKKQYKSLVFNSDKNEWFVNEKMKYRGRKIIMYSTL